jgi:hypothetical protein
LRIFLYEIRAHGSNHIELAEKNQGLGKSVNRLEGGIVTSGYKIDFSLSNRQKEK